MSSKLYNQLHKAFSERVEDGNRKYLQNMEVAMNKVASNGQFIAEDVPLQVALFLKTYYESQGFQVLIPNDGSRLIIEWKDEP